MMESIFKQALHRITFLFYQSGISRLFSEGVQCFAHILHIAQAACKVKQTVDILGEETGILIFNQLEGQFQLAELLWQQRILFEERVQGSIRIEDISVLIRPIECAAAQALQERERVLTAQQARR